MPSINHSKGAERHIRRVETYLHDAIVHFPGGVPRFSLDGEPIQPLGVDEAARITGRDEKYVWNVSNPCMDSHRIQLRDFLLLLLGGMDTAPLDAIERAVGRVAFRLPSVACAGDELHRESIRVGKEVGDIFERLTEITDPDGDGGARITGRELERMEAEANEAVAEICALVAAVRHRAGRHPA